MRHLWYDYWSMQYLQVFQYSLVYNCIAITGPFNCNKYNILNVWKNYKDRYFTGMITYNEATISSALKVS